MNPPSGRLACWPRSPVAGGAPKHTHPYTHPAARGAPAHQLQPHRLSPSPQRQSPPQHQAKLPAPVPPLAADRPELQATGWSCVRPHQLEGRWGRRAGLRLWPHPCSNSSQGRLSLPWPLIPAPPMHGVDLDEVFQQKLYFW